MNFKQLIDLKEPGVFVLSIYTFFYCPKDECDSDDSFSILIRERDSLTYNVIFKNGTLHGRTRDIQWIKETVYFSTSASQIYVNNFFICLYFKIFLLIFFKDSL